MACINLNIVSNFLLNTADGYGYTSPWIDVTRSSLYNLSVVFTGGTPSGTLKLQQSNDIPVDSSVGHFPRWAFPATSGSYIDDSADVLSGYGNNTANVIGAGKYLLNQQFVGYGWFRFVYTPTVNSNTRLDAFLTMKTV